MRVQVLSLACLLPVACAVLCPGVGYADPILAPAITSIDLEAGVSYPRPYYCSPATSGEVSCYGTPSPLGQGLSYSTGDLTALMTGTDSYGSDPSVSGTLTLTGTLDPDQQFRSETTIEYQFAVDGPAGGTVPVSILSSGTSSISTRGTSAVIFAAAGIVYVYDSSGKILSQYATCAGNYYTGCATGPFTYDPTLTLATDTAYNIEIYSDVLLRSVDGDSTPVTYTASASVDPTITLDTTDPAYSLEFSPAPTPEPGSLWLALTGVVTTFGAGLVKRRFDARG